MKNVISTDKAPQAVGPYSQAIKADSLIFLSGQIPLDPATGVIVGDTAAEQAEQVLKNIGEVLKAAGASYPDVVKTTVFLTDINDFAAVNEVYKRFFTEKYPARSAVAVAALPKGAKVEIEAIAEIH